jgi:hypothetical protein
LTSINQVQLLPKSFYTSAEFQDFGEAARDPDDDVSSKRVLCERAAVAGYMKPVLRTL